MLLLSDCGHILENRGFTGPKIAGGRDVESEATVSIQMSRLPKE